MADDLCSFNKDFFINKTPKKSPLLLRTVVLLFSMICGVYIFSICLKQISTFRKTNKFLDVQMIGQPCRALDIEHWEIPYVHFPKPHTYSRNECACNPVRFFAILSVQRSGSGWFETLLNSHINVSSNGEIFSVKDRRSNISSITATLDKVYNLDWFSSAAKNECSAAVGFKWMLNQEAIFFPIVVCVIPAGNQNLAQRMVAGVPLVQVNMQEGLMDHHNEIVEYFNRRGVLAVFLFRRNLLRRMISVLANTYDRDAKLLNGTHKSHVHSPHEAEILARYKPTINATLLIPNLKHEEDRIIRALEYFKSTRHTILYYEDLINNRTKLMDVQEFLRIPQRKLKSRQVKIHKAALSEQISNWADVENALKGTKYESFLQ